MTVREINFDGIVGPTHNYAGLSLGNIASAHHRGHTAYPRAAALQGLAKMRGNMARGLAQGFLLPLPRPNGALLDTLAVEPARDPVQGAVPNPALLAAAWSASSMWTANAATVSPAADTADGRCHLTPANLVTMLHRAQEWPETRAQLVLAFADSRHFVVHDPVPATFGDEGAANHMRLCERHAQPGIEVFVYGRPGGAFPARQHEQASRTVARKHGLDPARCVFVEQNPAAIEAGAFHNDVVAVANERVLFAHELAFADGGAALNEMKRAFPALQVVSVPENLITLDHAIATYLFNSQLVTLPDGSTCLIAPKEADTDPIRRWAATALAPHAPIQRLEFVDVKQSMANGGGPACLRLRVIADPAHVDPRFLLDDAKADRIAAVIERTWPEAIDPSQIGTEALTEAVITARSALLTTLDLLELR